jgi:hypothetical protein
MELLTTGEAAKVFGLRLEHEGALSAIKVGSPAF